MAFNARNFFAGIGTTFVIIGAGFGGGLMFAKTAVHETPAQTRASSHQLEPVRVILPTLAEAAPAPQPAPVREQPVQEATVPEKQVDKVDMKKTEAQERASKKPYAERKARKIAVARRRMDARQLMEQARAPQPNIMAFGGDETRVGFFGN